MSWDIIDYHRDKARKKKYNILIWGSSKENKITYNLRIKIKEYLNKNGHSAKISEELLKYGDYEPAPNSIIDEIFHALAADIIVVLYKSRGTQTEIDTILKFDEVARKAILFIEKEILKKIKTSISAKNWDCLKCKINEIDSFKIKEILNTINNYIEEKQFIEYYRYLQLERIKNEN